MNIRLSHDNVVTRGCFYWLLWILVCVRCVKSEESTTPSVSNLIVSRETNLSSPEIYEVKQNNSKCSYATDLETTFDSEPARETCCREIIKSFHNDWIYVLVQLSDVLKLLKKFECPEFQEQCTKRVYAFSDFNKLTYDRFCNETTFDSKCGSEIKDVLDSYNNREATNDSTDTSRKYSMTTELIRPTKYMTIQKDLSTLAKENLSLIDMLRPCIQVALIDTEKRPKDGYFEMKDTQVPMCGIVWCGFYGSAFERYDISEWSCTPSRCRANIIIFMVTCGILAFTSTLVNIVSLVVFFKNRRLRDSQGMYKISLAIADLLIGLFVFTTAIETMRRAYIPKIDMITADQSDGKWPKLKIYSFTEPYHNFVGFFTTLSNSVSIYTLMLAGFDRFMVVFRPLRYNVYTAKSLATKLVIGAWVLCGILALLPIVHPGMKYQVIAGFLESMTGDHEEIILIITFGIPIFSVLTVSVATLVYSKKNARARPKHIPAGKKVREMSVENRLAKTLLIMVGAFLISLLPLAIIIALHMVLPQTHHSNYDAINQESLTLFSSLEMVFCIIFVSNSLWNFFIYNVRSAEFRDACRKLITDTKIAARSKLFRDSAKEARQRRTSAAISNSSQNPCTASTVANV